jgi:YidC/Oxa1 family membrane protein insertase
VAVMTRQKVNLRLHAEFMNIFTTVFFQPIYNALVYIYVVLPVTDIALAILALTIIIKLILLPFSVKMLRSQKKLQDLQPKMQELQKKHKGNKEVLGRATMELYKKEKVNPLSSCLPLLIQLPILFAVFKVFQVGLKVETLSLLYPFVTNPGMINPVAAGLVDLSQSSIVLALLTGMAQFWQTRMLTRSRQPQVKGAQDENMASLMNRQMNYILPVVTVIIGATLPSGLVFYWLLFSLFTIAQQYWLFHQKEDSVMVKE